MRRANHCRIGIYIDSKRSLLRVISEAVVKRREEERELVLPRFGQQHSTEGEVLKDVAETYIEIGTDIPDTDIAVNSRGPERRRDAEAPSV
jgi:hypothetical protein